MGLEKKLVLGLVKDVQYPVAGHTRDINSIVCTQVYYSVDG